MKWDTNFTETDLDELLVMMFVFMAEQGMLDDLIEKYEENSEMG